MNKSELIEQLAARLGITMTESERFLNGLIKLVYETVREGEKVNIHGFGQFSYTDRKARLGVNPRNPSEKITIPQLKCVKFKAGLAFKDAINN